MLVHDFQSQVGVLPESRRVTLELTVNNHPGVMSQICGLFARRGYNVEAIVCVPIAKVEFSRIWLLVNEEQRLDQIVKQVWKLGDVLDIRSTTVDHSVFVQTVELFESHMSRIV